MVHSLARPFLTVLVLTGMLPVAHAQLGFEAPTARNHPALDAARFGKAFAGRFNQDPNPDGILLDGSTVTLMTTPEAHQTCLRSPFPVHDAALLPGGGVGGADALAAVDDVGLHRQFWDGGWVQTAIRGGSWAHARALRVGDIDARHGLDYAGLADAQVDERQVLVHYDGPQSFGAITSFQSAFPAYDLELLDWDGDGQLEICCLTEFGLEIYTGSGVPLYGYPWSYTPLRTTVLKAQGDGREKLAIVAANEPRTQEWLCVFGEGGIEGPWALGPAGVVRLKAADLDGDGDSDLVLSVTSAAEVWTLENGSTPGLLFDVPGALTQHPLDPNQHSPSHNQAGVAVADFDLDGDPDLLVPLQGDHDGVPPGQEEIASSVALLRSRILDHTELQGDVESCRYVFDQELDTGGIELVLIPPGVLLPSGPGESLEWEVVVWSTASLAAATSPVAFHVERLPIPDGNLPPQERTFFLFTDESGYDFSTLHSFEIRQVLVDASDLLLARGPALTAIHGAAETWPQVMNLPGVLRALSATVIFRTLSVLGGGGTEDGSISGGGLAIPPPPPSFDADEEPVH